MKVLFTGASSFTGFWFVQELAIAGHEVTAIFRRTAEEYSDSVRRQRVMLASQASRPIFGCSFGDEQFLRLIAEGGWDVLCHHGADVTNYKSLSFDAIAALRNNAFNLPAVLDALKRVDCQRVLLTGSIFEGGEGMALRAYLTFLPTVCRRPSLHGPFTTTVLNLTSALASLSSPIRSGLLKSHGLRLMFSKPGLPAAPRYALAQLMSGTISMCHYWPRRTPNSWRLFQPRAWLSLAPVGMSRVKGRSRSA